MLEPSVSPTSSMETLVPHRFTSAHSLGGTSVESQSLASDVSLAWAEKWVRAEEKRAKAHKGPFRRPEYAESDALRDARNFRQDFQSALRQGLSLEYALQAPVSPVGKTILEVIVETKSFLGLNSLTAAVGFGELDVGQFKIGKSFLMLRNENDESRGFGLSFSGHRDFVGQMVDGSPEGWGKLYESQWCFFEGQFQKGKPHGEGVLCRSSTRDISFVVHREEGTWFDGSPFTVEVSDFSKPSFFSQIKEEVKSWFFDPCQKEKRE